MPEVPWLATWMESALDVVSRLSGMVVRRVVELTKVVGSASPFTLKTDVLVKPLPVAVTATAGEPTRALFGTISCSTGLLWPKRGQATAIQKTSNLKALFMKILLAVYAPFTTTLSCGVSELSLTGDESILYGRVLENSHARHNQAVEGVPLLARGSAKPLNGARGSYCSGAL